MLDGPIRGTVNDRPWGITLAALGLDGFTGQLTLHAEDQRSYRIAFYRGTIVSASSPLPADAAVRVALTTKMITPAQANELKQRVRQTPAGIDEIDVMKRALRWTSTEAEQLRRLVIVRCAARTFAVDHGSYLLEDRIGTGGIEGEVDVREVVYLGIRMNLSDLRLACDLRQLGAWFVLKPKTVVDLSGFGFTEAEAPILEALRGGTNLASLEARNRDVDPRTAQAVLYALAACDAVVCCEPPAMTSTDTPAERTAPIVSRVPTRRDPTVTRVPTRRDPMVSRVPTPRHPTMSTFETSPWGLPTTVLPRASRETHGPEAFVAAGTPREAVPVPIGAEDSRFVETRTTTVRPNELAVHQIEQLIAERTRLLDRGADHFTLLGLPRGASAEQVRTAYVELARYLEPRNLAARGIRDDSYSARRLFAQICIAVTTLTDPARRRDYVATMRA